MVSKLMAEIEEEEVGDSWEDIEEEDLIRRLTTRQQEVLSKQEQTLPSPKNPVSNERVFVDGPMKIKYSEGSEYVAPIKILKRPSDNENHSSTAPVEQRSQRSLAEREAEYASARARILGEGNNSSSSKNPMEKKVIQRHTTK